MPEPRDEAVFTSFDGTRTRRAALFPVPGHDVAARSRDLALLLGIVADTLDTDLVLLGHVDPEKYTVAAAYSRRPGFTMPAGAIIPIGETFCREEITSDAPFVLGDAEVEGIFGSHPGFTKHGLRAYVGAPLKLSDGRLYGTLCGVDTRSRHFPLEKVERLLLLARYVAAELETALGVAPPHAWAQA